MTAHQLGLLLHHLADEISLMRLGRLPRPPETARRRVPGDAVDACRDADYACRFAAHAVDACRDAAQ